MSLGHNTGSAQELTNFIERLEKLDGDRQAIAADVKVVKAELASAGFDLKTVSAVLKIRKAKPHDFQEAQAKPEVERLAKAYEPEPVPDVDEGGAKQLGRDYANANRAVIDNPFPYGDARRARFDEGWREASGGDGMGPKGSGSGKK